MWLLYFDINVSRKIELKLLSNSLHLKPHKGIKYIPSNTDKVYIYKASSLLSTSRPPLKSIKSDSNNNKISKSDTKMYSRFTKSSSSSNPSFSTKMEIKQQRLQKQISMLFSNGRQARFYSVPRLVTYCYLFIAVAGILFLSILIPLCMVEYDTNGHSKVSFPFIFYVYDIICFFVCTGATRSDWPCILVVFWVFVDQIASNTIHSICI